MLFPRCSLYILPAPLSETEPLDELPLKLSSIIETLDGVICETAKVARNYFKKFSLKMPLQELKFMELNEHTTVSALQEIALVIEKGGNFALVSDCGLACIADPGAKLVALARSRGIPVKTLPGPCSITHALQLSGLVSQKFAFHSYLPKDPYELLKKLQKRSRQEKSIQIFIETPYRNQALFNILLTQLDPDTELCIAADLAGKEEQVITNTIKKWQKTGDFTLPKMPTIFLILA